MLLLKNSFSLIQLIYRLNYQFSYYVCLFVWANSEFGNNTKLSLYKSILVTIQLFNNQISTTNISICDIDSVT